MTYVERMIVRRGHPKHIIVGIVAFLWVVYFLDSSEEFMGKLRLR
jgi:hypothetical protein